MSHVQQSRVINAPIAPTWEAVSKMGAVQDWHPNVARAEVLSDHDSGIGASRRVEFQDDNSLVETVVEEVDRQFTKAEMSGSPVLKEAFVTISTAERSIDETEVTFSLEYTLKYGPIGWVMDAVMMRRLFHKAFDMALDGLSYHLETGDLITDSIPERSPSMA